MLSCVLIPYFPSCAWEPLNVDRTELHLPSLGWDIGEQITAKVIMPCYFPLSWCWWGLFIVKWDSLSPLFPNPLIWTGKIHELDDGSNKNVDGSPMHSQSKLAQRLLMSKSTTNNVSCVPPLPFNMLMGLGCCQMRFSPLFFWSTNFEGNIIYGTP